MKALILVLALILGGFVTADAQTAETVNLRVHNTKKLLKSKLKIEFLSVVEDSRCPSDVNCIHAGNAKIKVRIVKRGSRAQTIELNTLQPDSAPAVHGYKLRLTALTPAPATNIRINPNGYVATIVLTKA